MANLIEDATVSDRQKMVMLKLMEIPYGKTVSYSEFAKMCGHERAIRNVATLVGKNPFPIIIPCHRVVRKNGDIGNYSLGGTSIKKWLLEFESFLEGM